MDVITVLQFCERSSSSGDQLLGVREQNADGEDGDTERGVGIESL
jgi:hypothetical protein